MKRINLLILLLFLFVANYAIAQDCPCDTNEFIANGITGNDIVEILCPGGSLGEGTGFIFNPDEVKIFSDRFEYQVLTNSPFCRTCDSDILVCINKTLTEQELVACRNRLTRGCSLGFPNNIPTLSEWSMIGMAAGLGLMGLFVAIRRRKAVA